MIKKFFIVLTIIVLTSSVASCKTTEEALEGEVVTVSEVCLNLESHKSLYYAYKKGYKEGNKLYQQFLFEKECVSFGTTVLAKKLAVVFSDKINDNFNLEIWKVLLSEERDVDGKLRYFYSANAIERKNVKETKVNYNGR